MAGVVRGIWWRDTRGLKASIDLTGAMTAEAALVDCGTLNVLSVPPVLFVITAVLIAGDCDSLPVYLKP